MRKGSKPGIQAVILYGSYGRGDAVSDSDVDVCVFTANTGGTTEDTIRALVPSLPNKPLNLVFYPPEAIKAMLDYGSLFLWHIKLEGKALFGHEYVEAILKGLKPFDQHLKEILFLMGLLLDLKEAMNSSWMPNELDLSILFTIARNTCIVLCHKQGKIVFGRYMCYKTACHLFPDLPLTEHTFSYLSKWKTIYERSPDPGARLPDRYEMRGLILEIERFLNYAYEQTKR